MREQSSKTDKDQQAGRVTASEFIEKVKRDHPDLYQSFEQHFRQHLRVEMADHDRFERDLRKKIEADLAAVERAAPPELKRQREPSREERPARIERIRVDEATLELLAWRKAHIKYIYLHRDLLWTPPVKPYRKGGPLPGDERLLSTFEWAIACALIYEASANWRHAMHEAALSAGARAIEEEGRSRKAYFGKLNDHKNWDGIHRTPKPHIGDTTKEVGSRGYKDRFDDLKRDRKTFLPVVPVTTTIGSLLRNAGLTDTRQNRTAVDAALERLRGPVLVLRSNREIDFLPLIKSMRVAGKKLHLKVHSRWFRNYGVKICTPLPRKNATALALYFYSAVVAKRRDKDKDEVHINNLCKRLHLTNDRRLHDVLADAEDALNKHLDRLGMRKVDLGVPCPGYLRVKRVK